MIPQAFTSRDMSDAYKWLQTLPPPVREEIKTMEQMVLLYLRAKRMNGAIPTREEVVSYVPPTSDTSLNQTKSGQEFQKNLKSLKFELDKFDVAANNAGPTAQQSSSLNSVPTSPLGIGSHSTAPHSPPPSSPFAAPSAPFSAPASPPAPAPAISNHAEPHALHPSTNTPANNMLAALRLDPRSRQIVNEIRENLNLSSDTEVIRMSLVLAHRSLKELLK